MIDAKNDTAPQKTEPETPDPVADESIGISEAEQQEKLKQTVKYSCSPGLLGFLHNQKAVFAISSYQSGRFYLVGRAPKGGMMINERFFRKAMGIQVSPDGSSILLATLFKLLKFENVLNEGQYINNVFDRCFVPRVTYTTGILDAHDIGAMDDGRIVFVNTRFNCLAVASERHSFNPIWKPPFISKIVDEDRCHLNGMALEKGKPRYVTAVSQSDTVDGWRDRRTDGGVVVDVDTNSVVCEGFSMPHSPRLHQGKLWVLNSGTGELGWVELGANAKAAKFHPIIFCPGFVRGLSFHGKFAFVGLSKPRYERFEGLALDDRLKKTDSEPWCGVQVIDLEKGTCAHWFRIDGPVAELYDVGVVPNASCAMSLGFATQEILQLITHDELKGL